MKRPLVLGIIGDSGAGKTTLAAGIVHLLGRGTVTDLCLDDYHRYDRAERHRRTITALDPACNHLALMRQHLGLLRRGEPVFKPVYDHRDGRFAAPEILAPRQVIIAHGLLGLHDAALASCYDLTVFLDPEPALRARWKIERDTMRRGYARRQVERALAHRRRDEERYVAPQRARADLVISFVPHGQWSAGGDASHLDARISIRGGAALAADARSPLRRAGEHGILEIDGAADEPTAVALARGLVAAIGDGETLAEKASDGLVAGRRLASQALAEFARLGAFVDRGGVHRSSSLAIAQLVVTLSLVARSSGGRSAGREGVARRTRPASTARGRERPRSPVAGAAGPAGAGSRAG